MKKLLAMLLAGMVVFYLYMRVYIVGTGIFDRPFFKREKRVVGDADTYEISI